MKRKEPAPAPRRRGPLAIAAVLVFLIAAVALWPGPSGSAPPPAAAAAEPSDEPPAGGFAVENDERSEDPWYPGKETEDSP